MDSEFYGSEYYIRPYRERIEEAHGQGCQCRDQKYLHPGDIKIAVVVDEGKGQDFYNALVSNTPSPIKYSSPVSQNILDQDKLIQVFPLTVNKEKSKVVSAKELFER